MGLEVAVLWLAELRCRWIGIDVELAVHGVRSVGCNLRFSRAERSGGGLWPSISDGSEALLSGTGCNSSFKTQANSFSRLIQAVAVGLLAPTRCNLFFRAELV